MCGIIGYIGRHKAAPILLDSLEKLEYRGYDSAGIAVFDGDMIDVIKAKGRISGLRELVQIHGEPGGTVGIGHTRWATHGEPNDINSHPHLSASGRIAVVHNGIVENHRELRAFLEEHGYAFVSQTDTEVISHLIDYCYDGASPEAAVRNAVSMLRGTYALCVLFADYPDRVFALRKDSPLIIGLCENENMIASDIPAVLNRTRRIIRLDEGDLAIVGRDSVEILNALDEQVSKEIKDIDWDINAAEKDGYEHFMLKEIMQQPATVRNTINAYVREGKIDFSLNKVDDAYIRDIDTVTIVACGSAYHAGVVGSVLIENILRIPVRCELASEFIYSDPLINGKTLTIVISQSGETTDTQKAMRLAQANGSRTIAIVNVVGSAIANESDDCIYTHAGPEIAVATTKAYTAQLVVLYMLIAYIAGIRKGDNASAFDEAAVLAELQRLPNMIEDILKDDLNEIKLLASKYHSANDVFFLGRRLGYALALEASLKLKEISYIHSEAYAAGELKHGTISLIEDGTLVLALCTNDNLIEKMQSNMAEVKTRGATVIAIAKHGATTVNDYCDHCIMLPECAEFLTPSLAIIPLQLFAYYTALLRGCDIDKPRNLAKSVTVE